MRTHANKSRFSEQQTHIRLGYLMAYLLNSRAVKIWPGWFFLLLGLAVADASYGQEGGTTESSSLCSAIPETWTARPGSMSGELTGYSYDNFGADLSKPIGGWDKYYAERIITKSDDEEVVRTIDALNDSIVSAKSKTSRDTIFIAPKVDKLQSSETIPDNVTLAYFVDTANILHLRLALRRADPGDIVFISISSQDSIAINSTLDIKEGVTLASNRGELIGEPDANDNYDSNDFAPGALLYIDEVVGGDDMLHVNGDNVRITGLRLRGPQREVHPWDEGHDWVAIRNGFEDDPIGRQNLEVDNCEIFQWPQSAVYVAHEGTACVRNNYIHHNQRWKSGYGVGLQGSAKVSIEENLFASQPPLHCRYGLPHPRIHCPPQRRAR